MVIRSSTYVRSFVAAISLLLGSVTDLASAQTIETFTSLSPASGNEFGQAVGAGKIVGTMDWAIVGEPNATMSGLSQAGKVQFFPAVESPTTPRFEMSAPGTEIQAGATFGASIATGDINGDGNGDVVVGAPGYTIGARTHHGRVYIFFGPWSPLAFQPYHDYTVLDVKPSDGDPNDPNQGDLFGTSLAVGNLNNLPGLDVVVGAPNAAGLTTFGYITTEGGAVDIFLDPPVGSHISNYRYERITLLTPYLPTPNGHHYGWSVAIGNFGDRADDPLPDVLAGAPEWDHPIFADIGTWQVNFGRGAASTPTWATVAGYIQGVGIVSGATTASRAGAAVAAGNYNGDSYDDAAIGCPGNLAGDGSPLGPEGQVAILYGTPSGLVTAGSSGQDVIHAPGLMATSTNLFGLSLVWADTDAANQLDLVIGAPGIDAPFRPGSQIGKVLVAHATASQLPYQWGLTVLSIVGNDGMRFGWAVAKGSRLDDPSVPGGDDVFIGAPMQSIFGVPNAGLAYAWNY